MLINCTRMNGIGKRSRKHIGRLRVQLINAELPNNIILQVPTYLFLRCHVISLI